MKNHTIRNRIITPMLAWAAVGALSMIFAGSVFADTGTIISSSFSLGYGATTYGIQSAQWDTSETAGSNTSVTGPFSLSVVFSSRTPAADGDSYDNGASGSGPVFTGRTLADSPGGPGTGFSSWSPRFQVTVSGSYTGGTPVDAAPIPNYQFSLAITSIRIWGTALDYGSVSDRDLYFTETTPLHGASSPPQLLPYRTNPFESVHEAAYYAQLAWDPTDFNTAGLSDARTFVLDTASFPHQRAIDGFEVFGNLVVTYDAIPEPGTMMFLGLGGLLLIRRRRTR
jgi:hypothetical protein